MVINLAKFGMVIFNKKQLCYGRIAGLVENYGKIFILIATSDPATTSRWDPDDCRVQTDVEHGFVGDPVTNAAVTISSFIEERAV